MDSIHDRVSEFHPSRPWDIPGQPYSQERYEKYYRPVQRDFQRNGCAAFGERCGPVDRSFKTQAAGMLYELLGDDLDGAAAMLEDLDGML